MQKIGFDLTPSAPTAQQSALTLQDAIVGFAGLMAVLDHYGAAYADAYRQARLNLKNNLQ